MEELKPCPFCGRKITTYAAEYLGSMTKRLELRCDNCYASFDIDIDAFYFSNRPVLLKDAVDIWNRRANDEHTN